MSFGKNKLLLQKSRATMLLRCGAAPAPYRMQEYRTAAAGPRGGDDEKNPVLLCVVCNLYPAVSPVTPAAPSQPPQPPMATRRTALSPWCCIRPTLSPVPYFSPHPRPAPSTCTAPVSFARLQHWTRRSSSCSRSWDWLDLGYRYYSASSSYTS